MPYLPQIAANADAPPFHSPLGTALVATGAGLLFTTVGFLLVMGASRQTKNSADALLDDVSQLRPLAWFNISFFFGGDKEHWARHMSHVQPLVLGGLFMLMGGPTLIIGLVDLLR